MKICTIASTTNGHPPGHSPHGPFSPLKGSPSVFVEGRAVVRIGDPCPAHSPSFVPTTPIAEGSSVVFADGLPVAGEGHKLACGDFLSQGEDFAEMD